MIFTLWKKELESYFSAPLAYVLIGLFSLISGIIFFNLLVTYTDGIQAMPQNYTEQVSFVEEVVLKFFANVNFLFLVFIPLITMKLFSEEIRLETLDLYWLSPIKEWELVTAKTLAALTLVLSMLLITGVFPLVIWGVGIRDVHLLGTSYFAVTMNACAYIALGLFCSSISGNQIIAALLSVLGIMFLWMITWGGHLNSNYVVAEIFTYIGITSHFERLLRGIIGTQDIIYYSTFVLVFSFLTVKSLGRRNW
ncbi:MAG: ABC transporter permease subunit [Bdellovibrionales bacterium]|nr:ABC transporter permease subunit [Bdellovibrionales bacterium]